MNCPYCGSRLSKRDRCDRCGEDMTMFKRVYRISNSYYNAGLRKARVRDLSGAVSDLKSCLKLNKRHTDARNLLGLIYQEMGETVSALSQWVISKHFQNEDNAADRYINLVQQNPSKLESVNQVIKKYNGALTSARQGNDDLAIIQLKKVVSLNPHYVQALQLLGLLYIRNNDYDRARKCLLRAKNVDVTNTTTLSYLDAISEDGGDKAEEKTLSDTRSRDSVSDRDVITPIHTYAEEKPNIIAWVNLVLGVIIGAAFIMIAIVPGIRKNAVTDQSGEIVTLNEKLVKAEAKLESAVNEKASLEQDLEELRYQLSHQEEPEVVEEDKSVYENLMQAAVFFMEEDPVQATDTLLQVKKKDLKLDSAVTLYEKLSGGLFAEQSAEVYEEGHTLYTDGSYEEALKVFEKALELNPDNVDAIYFTGRSHHRLGDVETAKLWYNRLVDDYPDSGRAKEAKDRLREIE